MDIQFFSTLPPALNNCFVFEQINPTDPRIEEIYRLRYQVYCLECGFENPDDHPQGLEHDEYDICSSHFCAISVHSGRVVGTVRVIHATPLGLPIQKYCNLDLNNQLKGGNSFVGEVSRLAISKNFRRHEINQIVSNVAGCNQYWMIDSLQLRRTLEAYIVAGLYRSLHQYSLDVGLTHWYAVMAKGLPRLLQRNQIHWIQIGKEVDCHGIRIPYMRAIRKSQEQHEAA